MQSTRYPDSLTHRSPLRSLPPRTTQIPSNRLQKTSNPSFDVETPSLVSNHPFPTSAEGPNPSSPTTENAAEIVHNYFSHIIPKSRKNQKKKISPDECQILYHTSSCTEPPLSSSHHHSSSQAPPSPPAISQSLENIHPSALVQISSLSSLPLEVLPYQEINNAEENTSCAIAYPLNDDGHSHRTLFSSQSDFHTLFQDKSPSREREEIPQEDSSHHVKELIGKNGELMDFFVHSEYKKTIPRRKSRPPHISAPLNYRGMKREKSLAKPSAHVKIMSPVRVLRHNNNALKEEVERLQEERAALQREVAKEKALRIRYAHHFANSETKIKNLQQKINNPRMYASEVARVEHPKPEVDCNQLQTTISILRAQMVSREEENKNLRSVILQHKGVIEEYQLRCAEVDEEKKRMTVSWMQEKKKSRRWKDRMEAAESAASQMKVACIQIMSTLKERMVQMKKERQAHALFVDAVNSGQLPLNTSGIDYKALHSVEGIDLLSITAQREGEDGGNEERKSKCGEEEDRGEDKRGEERRGEEGRREESTGVERRMEERRERECCEKEEFWEGEESWKEEERWEEEQRWERDAQWTGEEEEEYWHGEEEDSECARNCSDDGHLSISSDEEEREERRGEERSGKEKRNEKEERELFSYAEEEKKEERDTITALSVESSPR